MGGISSARRQESEVRSRLITFRSCRRVQFSRMERLERIDRFDRLRLYVPFYKLQHNFIRGEVGEGKTVLLNRLHLLVQVEMG